MRVRQSPTVARPPHGGAQTARAGQFKRLRW
jgi:hypothetical protein